MSPNGIDFIKVLCIIANFADGTEFWREETAIIYVQMENYEN